MKFAEMRMLSQLEQGSEKLYRIRIEIQKPKRGAYLGMSGIGFDACDTWLRYHKPLWWKEDPLTPKQKRIFRMGDIIEEEVVAFIKKGGGSVTDRQRGFQDFDGNYRGHWDGLWENSHVLEIKSANKERFERFRYIEDFKETFKGYYAQVQTYMYYSQLPTAMVVFYNKNDSEFWCREIAYDDEYAGFLRMKAYIILKTKLPCYIPEVFRDTEKCKECKYREFCLNAKG